jgi:hypothetical protein
MRCELCKFAKSFSKETSCYLIKEEEQTENDWGMGCKYNQRTLDKKMKTLCKSAGNPVFW